MTAHPVLLSACTALSILLSSSAVLANMPVPGDDEEKEEKEDKAREGGNAADKATQSPPAAGLPTVDRASLPPDYYSEMGDFWALFFKSGDPFVSGAELGNLGASLDPPQLTLEPLPSDAPAESIFDQIDESQAQLPMVGEAGSQATVAGADPTPPPESILDYIDQPAPAPAGAPDPAKPAANQAPAPPVVPSPH